MNLSPNRNGGFGATRRTFLRTATAATFAPVLAAQQTKPNQQDDVQLSQIHAPTEQPEKVPGPFESTPQRTGLAIVGLGRLALGEILPALAKTKYCKPVALVSGDRDKARKIAAQYGVKEASLYDYTTYDQLTQNPEVQVIYIVLQPHTPGEEGLQDQRITDAIYESARTGHTVKLTPPPSPTRGPDPADA